MLSIMFWLDYEILLKSVPGTNPF